MVLPESAGAVQNDGLAARVLTPGVENGLDDAIELARPADESFWGRLAARNGERVA